MGRKKKEELKATTHHIFNPDELPRPTLYYPEITPDYLDVTTLDDSYHRTYIDNRPYSITTTSGGSDDRYVISPYSTTTSGWSHTDTLSMRDYIDLRRFEEQEVENVNVISEEPFRGQHVVRCTDVQDLLVDRILKTLSAMKGKLMLDVAPVHIQKIECSMTPIIRKNIVTASKKLKMYGKMCPIIARFDDYGNRLPDEIDLGVANGVILKIVDPESYGEFYLEMRATEFYNRDYISGT